MGVVVRQADGHERAAVRAVVRLAWLDAYAGIFTRADIEGLFAERLAQSGSWVDDRDAYAGTLVADDAGQIVGMAGLAVRADGSGELTSLYVLPERQGQGIGRALWDAALTALRARGCPRMQVWVLARAAQAVQFYERRGAIRVAEGTYSVGDHAETAWGYCVVLAATQRAVISGLDHS